MIIETEVEFVEERFPDDHHTAISTWAKMCVNLTEVIAISELVSEGEVVEGVSQISLIGLGSWTIRMPYPTLRKLWQKANPELIFGAN